MADLGFNIKVDTGELSKVPRLISEVEKTFKQMARTAGFSKEQTDSLSNSLRALKENARQNVKEIRQKSTELNKQARAAIRAAESNRIQQASLDKTTDANKKLQNQLRAVTLQHEYVAKGVGVSVREMQNLIKVEEQAIVKANQMRLAGAARSTYIESQINKHKILSQKIREQTKATSDLIRKQEEQQARHKRIMSGTMVYAAGGVVSKDAVRNLNKYNTAADIASKKTKGLATVMREIAPAVGALGVFALAAQGIRAFVQTADQITNLDNRIRLLSDNTASLSTEFDNLYRIANESRSSLVDVGTLFSRLVPIMGNLGGTTKEAAGITEAFSKLLLISGTSTREASSALLQFSQAMGKGKLDGDEFRTVAEATPEVLRILEKQLNKTREELFQMSKDGELTADILGNALISSLDGLDEKLKSVPFTFAQSLQVLRTELTSSVKKINEAFNITGGLADITRDLTQGIKSTTDALVSFYKENEAVISSVMESIVTAGKLYLNYKLITGVFGLFSSKIIPKLKDGLLSLAAGFKIVEGAMYGSVAAAKILKTALIQTGVGALAVGLGLLAEKFLFAENSMLSFFDSANNVDVLDRLNEKIAESERRVNEAANPRARRAAERQLISLKKERLEVQKKISEEVKKEAELEKLTKPVNVSEVYEEISKLDKSYQEYGKSKKELMLIQAKEVESKAALARAQATELALNKELSDEDYQRSLRLFSLVRAYDELSEKLKRNAEQLSDNSYSSFLDKIKMTNKELKLTASGLGESALNQLKFNESIKKFSPEQQKNLKALYAQNEALEKEVKLRDKLIAQKVEEFEKTEDVFASAKEMPDVFKDYKKAQESATESVEDNIKKTQEQLKLLGKSSSEVREYNLQKLKQKLVEEQASLAISGSTESLKKQIKETEKLNNLLGELEKQQALKEFSEGFADAFYDGVDSGIDYLKDQLTRQAFNILLKPTLESIGGQIGSLLGIGGGQAGLSAGALFSNQGGALGSLATGGLAGLGLNSFLNNAGTIFSGTYDVVKMLGGTVQTAATVAGTTANIASKIAPYAGSIVSLIQGDLGGAAGGAAGTYIGGAFGGPLGAAIGGFIGSQLTGGLFGGGKISASSLGSDVLGPISQALDETFKTTLESLGGVGSASFNVSGNTGRQGQNPNFTLSGQNYSSSDFFGGDDLFLRGEIALNEQNVAEQITRAVFGALKSSDFADNIDQLFASLDPVTASIEELNNALTQASLINDLNTALAGMDNGLKALSESSLEAMESFFKAVGGIEGLNQALSFFYQEFTSEADKIKDSEKLITETLSGIGRVLPQTRDGFKDLFNSLDPKNFAIVSKLLPEIDAYYDRAEEVSKSFVDLFSNIQTGIRDLIESTNIQRESIRSLKNEILGVSNTRSLSEIINEARSIATGTSAPSIVGTSGSDARLQAIASERSSVVNRLNSAQQLSSNLTNDLNREVGILQRAVELFNSNNRFGSAFATNRSGGLATASFDESTMRAIVDYAWITFNSGDTASVSGLRERLNSSLGELGGRSIIGALGGGNIASIQSALASSASNIESLNSALAELDSQLKSIEEQRAREYQSYLDELAEFTAKATGDVDRLKGLKEETKAWYDEQKRLSDSFIESAESIRTLVSSLREVGASSTDTAKILKEKFDKAVFSARLGLNPLESSEIIRNVLPNLIGGLADSSVSALEFERNKALLLAQAESAASGITSQIDRSYEERALDVLNEIDSALLKISEEALSSEQALINAIDRSREQTVEGLRQIINAIQGGEVQAFATGGAFTNGVVSRPTAFNSSIMGEAGPEAILPLTNIGGSLGVKARADDSLVESVNLLREEVSMLRAEARATAINTRKTAKIMERIDEGDAIAVRTVTD